MPAYATRRTVLQKVRRRALAPPSAACKHGVSGSISLPSRGSFHLSLTVLCSIGHQGVFRVGGWSPLLQARFHVSRPTLDPASPARLSSTGLSPSLGRPSHGASTSSAGQFRGPNPATHARRFALLRVRSPLLTESIFSFSSSPYLDVSVQAVPPCTVCVPVQVRGCSPRGFPHSDIPGSSPMCGSPRLFAAYHVLLRLLVPRHPPRALSCLTFFPGTSRSVVTEFFVGSVRLPLLSEISFSEKTFAFEKTFVFSDVLINYSWIFDLLNYFSVVPSSV